MKSNKNFYEMTDEEKYQKILDLESENDVLKKIKSDWIDSQLVNKKFPHDYIIGKKRQTEQRNFNMQMLKDAQSLNSVISDKYYKLLIEHNILFQTYQDLKTAFELMKNKDLKDINK